MMQAQFDALVEDCAHRHADSIGQSGEQPDDVAEDAASDTVTLLGQRGRLAPCRISPL